MAQQEHALSGVAHMHFGALRYVGALRPAEKAEIVPPVPLAEIVPPVPPPKEAP